MGKMHIRELVVTVAIDFAKRFGIQIIVPQNRNMCLFLGTF